MQQRWKPDLQSELSWFLIAYLTMLLGVLLAVHVLPPALDGPGSALRSPVHQDRQMSSMRQAVAAQASAKDAVGSAIAAVTHPQ